MQRRYSIAGVLIAIAITCGSIWHYKSTIVPSTIVHTQYGDFEIQEPVIIDLINSKGVQRLKDIRQYGINYFLKKPEEYTRFEHSLGVMVLIRRFGGSLAEQIAGLLHDASHTAFSHLGDYVFMDDSIAGLRSYQDDKHVLILNRTDIPHVLEKHGYSLQDIHHKEGDFKLLEQELPDICADRLEYNLFGGILENLITKEEVHQILDNLRFEDGRWFFVDTNSARMFAEIPLYHTVHVWTCPFDTVTGKWLSEAVRRAFQIGLFAKDDFIYRTDDYLWKLLSQSDDSVIKELLWKAHHANDYYDVVNDGTEDTILKCKFRGIDPWVKTESGFKRLTEIDSEFAEEYEKVKQLMKNGWHIKYSNKK
jgi:HD superfamily phosphohydrolase